MTELHKSWLNDADLETGFALARQTIEARIRAGLTQDELANRMHTSRNVIARLESGRVLPSTRTLTRIAAATNSRLKIVFDPAQSPKSATKPKSLANA